MQSYPTTKLSPRIKDITGKRFGRLTVLSFSHIGGDGKAIWKCICDCGNSHFVDGCNLRRGNSRSCGCLAKELSSSRNSTHGMTHHPLARTYRAMIDRCYNPSTDSYPHYGGRGITVCERWLESITNFVTDMGERPEGKTLDRINLDGSYCPENCRWATPTEQMNNRTNSRLLTCNEQTMTIAQWSKITNISYGAIWRRLLAGWTVERTLSEPMRQTRRRQRIGHN